jgi:RecA-family ATPase
MLPLMQTTMLTGMGGIGKSLFAQALLTHIVLGRSFLGLDVEQRNALYVTCEDDEAELWRRQAAICSAIDVPLEAVIGKLHLCSLTGARDTSLATFNDSGMIQPTDRWLQIEETCADRDVGLYAFDNATDAMAGDLNDIHQVAEFVNLLTGLAIRRVGVAMIVHHPNKAGEDWLGSVAWHNKVRSRLIIEAGEEEADPDARVIRNPKANYGPTGGKIIFRWHRGTFLRDEDLPPEHAAEITANIRAAGANNRFLDCLEKTKAEKRAVSLSPSASNYAPRVFAKMTTGKGYAAKDFEGALERLLHLGTIANDQRIYQRDNRSWATGIGRVESAQTLAQTLAQTGAHECTNPDVEPA